MLKLTITNSVIESSVPSDTFIEDIITSRYVDALESSTSDEEMLKKVLCESLIKTIPVKLDYRNNNIDAAAKSLYSVAVNDNLSEYLRAPLFTILEGIGYLDKNHLEKQNLNEDILSSDNRNDLNTPIFEYIEESEVYDFILELYSKGWIPSINMDWYLHGLTESLYKTQQEVISALCTHSIDREVTESISNSESCMEESFPNETILDTILEFMIDNSSDSSVVAKTVTKDELDTLTMDFLTDSELSLLSGSQGQVYRTLVDFVNCIYQNLEVGDKYKEIINTIKYFHAGYVKYPTKMLHNVAILLNLYMTKMYELCTDNDVKSDIMSVKKYFLSDMDDFKCEILNNGDITDEAYRNLLTLWDILPRMDMRRNERLGRTNIDSNETLEVELPDYEEPVVESKVSTGTKSSELIKALTESFEVLKDGTIKVTIPKKSTYMDEYAENHRLLVANHKAKNYEGMKYNLVYHLILIDSIEKNVLYNTKVKKDSPLYEDAVKARSFAKNDISTYLPEVRQHVKEFDINHFYKEVRAEQSMITINGVETAQGVKKIIKSILL